jgi:hypothetical protein
VNSPAEDKPVFFLWLKKYLKRLSDLRLLQQRRLLTFIFFVFLAAVFWFARSMSEMYEEEVTYPVRYVNLPENKVLVNKPPEKLRLTIRAKGFSILRSKLNLNLVPLKFNISSFSLNSTGTDSFYIVTRTVKDILAAELDQVTILDIAPDTLFFSFTETAIKKVPVRAVLDLHDKFFQQQFMQNGSIATIPDSIIISGPGVLLRKINQVDTEPIQFNNLADTAEARFLLKPIDMVTFSQQHVQVTIPVDRFTEVEERVSVVPVNVPDSLNMIAVPGQVTITYLVCLSNYNKLTNNPPTPNIDYNMLKERQVTRLTVFLTDTPGIILNVRFNPTEIEFLITRK